MDKVWLSWALLNTLSAVLLDGADGEPVTGRLHPWQHVHLEVGRGCGEHLTDQVAKLAT